MKGALLILIALSLLIIGASSCQQVSEQKENNTVIQTIQNTAQNKTEIPVEARPESYTVIIENFLFKPYELTVTKGSTVTWINKDLPDAHTITLNDMTFSKRMESGQNVSLVFNTIGRYDYHCSVHGESARIIVK